MLGLTQEAADKLYTNQVDTGVLNLLIEHEKFGELMHLISQINIQLSSFRRSCADGKANIQQNP